MRTTKLPNTISAESNDSEITLVDFRTFKEVLQRQFNKMVKDGTIYQSHADRDFLWELYLKSFPEGTNPIFRERSEHDCSCCRSFIKNAGGMVSIIEGEIVSLWDIQVGGQYQPVVDALSDYIKSCKINNIYLHPERQIGVAKNFESLEDKTILTWNHFHFDLPLHITCNKDQIGPKTSEYDSQHKVFLRGLREISMEAIEIVQDLINQNSLYRGSEKKVLIDTFKKIKEEFSLITSEDAQEIFVWNQIGGQNNFVSKIRNDVIGTLLTDISEGMDLDKAVKSFEDKVSGTNYQRPTALITVKMKEDAKKKLQDLGLIASLERRYAKLEDLTVNNILYVDRNTKKLSNDDVFDSIPTTGQSVKSFEKVEEISIENFINNILPSAKSLKIFFDNQHQSNLVSLVAPYDLTAKSMFKWPNAFSWSYVGDVADSIKERVKAAGGNITGEVCCRLAWFNHDDLDFHMTEPERGKIAFNSKGPSPSGGRLDVDMNVNNLTNTPVENIFYPLISRMREGKYTLEVNQYNKRRSDDVGFEVEIDVLGTVHQFAYNRAVVGTIAVAEIVVSQKNEVTVVPLIPSSKASKEVWRLKTQDFYPVSALLLSPNFWDNQTIGNKHFFFMIEGCKNDGSARGFYNEFLGSALEAHKKTMEIVGSKMRTEESENQLSGLGFSSTKRDSVIVKVEGSFTRVLKVIF